MGRMWRRRTRGAAACALAFMILVCPAETAAAQTDAGQQGAWYPEKEHAGRDYSQMKYERYDIQVLDQLMADLEQAAGISGQEERVRELYHSILDEEARMSTMYSLADIAYGRDMDNQAATDELDYMADLYTEAVDKIAVSLKNALGDEYGLVLEEEMGAGNAEMIRYYEPMTPEQLKLHEEEQDLIRQYDESGSEDFQARVLGEEWTYERLEEEGDGYSDDYYEIKAALDKQKNQKVGEIYRQLVKVRTQIAEGWGYDSYADYAYEIQYGRDFTPLEMERVRKDVKKVITPLLEDCWYAEVDYSALYNRPKESTENILDRLEPHINDINGELGEAYAYMREHGLYDIERQEDGANRSGSYTTDLPMYGDSFLFVTRDDNYLDYSNIIHEFGHFSSIYHDNVPSLYANSYIDVSEVQSQGLQVLFLNYGDELFGKGAEAMENSVVGDMLDSIVIGAMVDEFETAVYEDPDMSLGEMNRLFRDISGEYDDWYYTCDGDECYEWDAIPHIYRSPLYYVSYSTSAYPALCLWLESEDSWDQAVDRYMSISALGNTYPYRETMEECGAGDIFTEGALTELDQKVRERMGLELSEEGAFGENGAQGSGGVTNEKLHGEILLALAGVAVVIVLQSMVLCTGFVIIWLLVKNRKK